MKSHASTSLPASLAASSSLLLGLCLPLSVFAADYTWTGSTTLLPWASGNWSGSSAVNPETGPTAADNYVGSTGSTSIVLNGDRAINHFLQPATQTGTMLISGYTGDSTFTATSITNASGQLLTFRNGAATATLQVTTTDLTVSGTANLQLGSSAANATAQATNAIKSLTVTGTTTISSTAKLILNITDAEYSLGLLRVDSSEVNLNHTQFTKAQASTAISTGLIGTGGVIQNATTNANNSSVLLVRNTTDYATSTVLQNGTGTLSFTKEGSARQTLDSANTYTGATSVKEGTLAIGPAGTLSGTSGVAVDADASFIYNNATTALAATVTLAGNGVGNRAILAGDGLIASALTLDDLGDTLSAGDGGVGQLGFSVDQTWQSFSLDWQVSDFTGGVAGDDFDQVAITAGALTLTGGAGDYLLNLHSLTLDGLAGATGNFTETTTSWVILSAANGIEGFVASHWTINTDGFSTAEGWTGEFSLSQVGNDLVLTYNAIPEPSAWSALAGAAAITGALLRRRRR